jgi:hypothetical protein
VLAVAAFAHLNDTPCFSMKSELQHNSGSGRGSCERFDIGRSWSVVARTSTLGGDRVEDLSFGGGERNTRADHKDIDIQATID